MSDASLAQISLAADPKLLRAARLMVSSLAADRGFAMDDMEDLKLAVQEACANRLALGLAQDRIHARVSELGGMLMVEVWGDRPGTGEVNEEADYGLALAEALVDELAIEDRPDAQRIVLRKRMPGGAAG
jgi:serine/threonine-protein kinase RsbW